MVAYVKCGISTVFLYLLINQVYSRKNNRPPDPSYIRVVSIEVAPYLFRIQDKHGRTEYRGYIKDILDLIVADLRMRFELYIVPDNQYGYLQDGTTWNGMIKELLDNNADLAAAPLHRTPTRARVVDFTRSIMNISATMLMRKPDNGRSPDIQSVDDLRNHPEVSVGTLETGTIRRSFMTTNDRVYIDLWSRIKNTRPSTLTTSNAEGIHRVRTEGGNYVYIMPSDIAVYNAGETPCNLLTVGKFFPRNLAFAVQKDSSNNNNNNLLQRINKAIYRLEASGDFDKLYSEWWLQNRPCRSFTNAAYLKHLYTNNSNSLTFSTLLLYFIGSIGHLLFALHR